VRPNQPPKKASVSLTQIAPTGNRLLDALPSRDLRRMLAACATVELACADVLYTSGEPLSHVYFPITSFISLIMPIDAAASLEVGLIGNEGMFGVPLVLGVGVSPVHAVVQATGLALRIEAPIFCRELGRSPVLQRQMDRYVFVRLSQFAQAAGCTRFHVVEERLARWLLMTQDRAHADNFHVTQEVLALMLGVRRVGVTKAASSLQERRLIRYARGDITVLDRRGLKTASCGCYKADREAYDRILG
jgi:CRP-like cAMP-binding protein